MPTFQTFVTFICIIGFAYAKSSLPPHEVHALQAVGRKLGKMDWDFHVDPCSGSSGWVDFDPLKRKENVIRCICTRNNNNVLRCNVDTISVRAQNLHGSIPPELARLSFLRIIDLSWNHLHGSIPPEWGSLKHLTNLKLACNRLSGTIPPSLGSLTYLEELSVSSNKFTGEIPETLANLTNLKSFRISDNNFTGRIPALIQKWTNLTQLIMHASGLSGPIPRTIALLSNMRDLRITDLSGNELSSLPNFSNMTYLRFLVLRSCNINGQLPNYIGEMKFLEVLDLSFNKLTGSIPDNFTNSTNIDYIYLTSNSLSGPLPQWLPNDAPTIDLSYNNFSTEDRNQSCQIGVINLFAASKGHTLGAASCLKSIQCATQYSSVHINCGGYQIVDDQGVVYEEDMDVGGPANFFISKSNWGFSSTGHFFNTPHDVDPFILEKNLSISEQNPQLYSSARFSPVSLTYYSFCMLNGNYTVELHFAEIMLTSYDKLSCPYDHGWRLFDIYIEGELAAKDFNIVQNAGGVEKGIRRKFNAVVNDNTLDIRFYWAGRGASTFYNVHGPLISAISVNPNFEPSPRGSTISTDIIVHVIVVILIILASFGLAILWWRVHRGNDHTPLPGAEVQHVQAEDMCTAQFSLEQIKAATDNFSPDNIIGQGRFGLVYRGHQSDGTVIAVKRLSQKSKQGSHEFVNEIGMISALQHPHLVKLYGCCSEDDQLLLIYEYMENNSLARALYGPKDQQLCLDWPVRRNICIGIARGLAYLHEESIIKIVHRDIKATNVLLDKDLVPKISDFGLTILGEDDKSHLTTHVAGTLGYMAPEYVMRGHLTDKVDVYSFGIVLLEIISGKKNTRMKSQGDCFFLLDWVNSLQDRGKLLALVDPRLESTFNETEVATTINVALLCTNVVPADRPSMSEVVSMLEGRANVPKDLVSGCSSRSST